MTTLAWDGRYLAADGRITTGTTIATDANQKITILGDYVVAIAGNVPDAKKLIDMLINGGKADSILSSSGLYILNGKCFSFGCDDDGELWECPSPYCNAVGTGEDHALTAMDCGNDAREAVQLSIKRDIYTGGHVTYYDIDDINGGIRTA